MSYQKVYMNQVHSSSLLCQLAQMWKSQLLCDAIIKTGTVTTKAHRLVLVAACPMLQSMENASVGDHLEVRLAAEIKQDSVNTFLQYLYEGFMMLTEENVRDVEKVARLLQVESIVTCCSDFDKCMRSKMGMLPPGANYKYNFHDQVEFRHVRTTDLQKTVQERMMKRAAEMARPSSPGHKRQRMHRPSSPPVDVASLSDHRFSSERISQTGSTGGPSSRSGYVDHSSMPGVVEIAEDTLELVHTEAPDGGTGPGRGHDQPIVKKSVAVSVASQINRNRELKVVNVTGDNETRTSSKPSPASGPTSRGAITVSPLTIPVDSTSLPRDSSSFPKTPDSANQSNVDFSQNDSFMFSTPHSDSSSQRSPFPVSLTQAGMSSSLGPKQFPSSSSQGSSKMSKPFAAGSAMQSSYSSSQSYSQSPSQRPQPHQRPEKSESIDRPSSGSSDGKQSLGGNIKSDQSESGSADMTPDLSIVKVEAGQRNQVEPSDTGGLDMYVDMHGQGVMHMHRQEDEEDPGETSDIEYEEPSGEWSNEGSNLSADQSASWHSGSFKDIGDQLFPIGLEELRKPRPGRVDPELAQAFNMIELLPSSGIFVYPKHIREVEHKGNGKRIARYLLSCFYTASELVAAGNLTGANFKKGLDPGIVETIVGYCIFVDPNVSASEVKQVLRSKITAHCCENKYKQQGIQRERYKRWMSQAQYLK